MPGSTQVTPSKPAKIFAALSTSRLGTAKVNFDEILNMKVGDIIPLTIPETIEATVDGVPVLDCTYGVLNGQYALKVEKLLSNADNLGK